MLLRTATIEWNDSMGDAVCEMGISLPGIAAAARPGQFLMIKSGRGTDPLLRRPFSIHRIEGEDTAVILYRIAGAGTAIMSQAGPGDRISLLGPLGKGFEPPASARFHVIVGGGIGVAPLLFLAQSGVGEGIFTETTSIAIIGAKSSAGLHAVERFSSLHMKVLTATEDGSAGTRGTAVDLAGRALSSAPGPVAVYACGPRGMITALAAVLRMHPAATCQVSVEERMACGMGVCRGCAVPVRKAGGKAYAAACRDGPVFDMNILAEGT